MATAFAAKWAIAHGLSGHAASLAATGLGVAVLVTAYQDEIVDAVIEGARAAGTSVYRLNRDEKAELVDEVRLSLIRKRNNSHKASINEAAPKAIIRLLLNY